MKTVYQIIMQNTTNQNLLEYLYYIFHVSYFINLTFAAQYKEQMITNISKSDTQIYGFDY